MDEKVTIKTIAKAANVSHTTVSRALNNSPLVKEETRKKIQDLANRMNYTPDLNAKALVEKRSFIISVYFSDLGSGTSPSFMSTIIHQIRSMLPKGYEITIDSFSALRRSKQKINLRFDGALVVSQAASDDEFIERLANIGKPVVVLNRKIERTDLYNYSSDDYAGTVNATDYLIRMGHRKMGLISGDEKFLSSYNRTQAFIDTMTKNDLTVPDKWNIKGNYSIKSGYEGMEEILSSGELPTCVFIANDDMAMGAIRACKDYGYSVPEQISIMGFDDSPYSDYLVPRLTTIKKPILEITTKGVNALKRLLVGQEPTGEHYMSIKPTLVIRESVKKLN